MQYRRLGRHGLMLSALSMDVRSSQLAGLERGEVRERLAAVVEAGINYFHTRTALEDAGAQQLLSELIRDLRLPRDSYCLGAQLGAATTARPWPGQQGLSLKALREACGQTLRRLHVDYLDLVICESEDAATPLEETVAAMEWLQRQGWILHWGVSGWSEAATTAAGRMAGPGAGPAAVLWEEEAGWPQAADAGLGGLLRPGGPTDALADADRIRRLRDRSGICSLALPLLSLTDRGQGPALLSALD